MFELSIPDRVEGLKLLVESCGWKAGIRDVCMYYDGGTSCLIVQSFSSGCPVEDV